MEKTESVPEEKPKKKDWTNTVLCVLFVWAVTAFALHYTVSTYKLLTAKPDPRLTTLVQVGGYSCIDLPKRIKCWRDDDGSE